MRLAVEQEHQGGLADLQLALVAGEGEVEDAAHDAAEALGGRGVARERVVGDALAHQREAEVHAEGLVLGQQVRGDGAARGTLRAEGVEADRGAVGQDAAEAAQLQGAGLERRGVERHDGDAPRRGGERLQAGLQVLLVIEVLLLHVLGAHQHALAPQRP